jgi:hypothetical protein
MKKIVFKEKMFTSIKYTNVSKCSFLRFWESSRGFSFICAASLNKSVDYIFNVGHQGRFLV